MAILVGNVLTVAPQVSTSAQVTRKCALTLVLLVIAARWALEALRRSVDRNHRCQLRLVCLAFDMIIMGTISYMLLVK